MSINIENDLLDISTATINAKKFFGYSMDDKVEICKVSDASDTIIFTGYIQESTNTVYTSSLVLYDERFYLKKKKVLADISGTMQISALLNQIITNWNSQTGDTMSSSVIDDFTVTVDIKIGDNLYGILQDLQKQKYTTTSGKELQFAFSFENGILKVAETLGIDRTIPGDSYFVANYWANDLHDSSIQDYSIKKSNNTANILVTKNPSYALTIDPDRQFLPKMAEYYDLTNKSDLLKILKDYTVNMEIEVKLSPLSPKIGVKILGSKIQIDILNGEEKYQNSAYVTKENIEISQAGVVKTISVQTNYNKLPELIRDIVQSNRKIFVNTL